MAQIRVIQAGRRKGLTLTLDGLKEAQQSFRKLLETLDETSANAEKAKLILQFHEIATSFRDKLRSAAISRGVPQRVIKAIFAARITNRYRVSVLAGSAKRFAARFPSAKKGGLRIEWKDFSKKAGSNPGKLVGMSLASAYDRGTKKTRPTQYFTSTYNAQRPNMLRQMMIAYRRMIKLG